MGINILDSGVLEKPEKLTSIITLHVLATKVLYKRISTNSHTDTNETFRTDRREESIRGEVGKGGAGVDDV